MDGIGDSVDTLRPDGHAPSLVDVAAARLWQLGFRGIVLDLDNTCCPYHQPNSPRASPTGSRRRAGWASALVVVSNNFSERVAAAGALLGVPTVPNALKPLPFGFLRALRLLGTRRRETVVIGDQVFTDVLGAKFLGLRSRPDRADRRARFSADARVALARTAALQAHPAGAGPSVFSRRRLTP